MSNESKEPSTLSEEDVANIQKRLSNANPDVINDIYRQYSDCLHSMISRARKQTEEEDEIIELERLKRIINIAPIDERFIRSKDKIWAARDHILNKNSKYFIEKDYSTNIKRDHNQAFIETLIEIVRDKFVNLPVKEQEFYWKKAALMLNCVVRFKKEIMEY